MAEFADREHYIPLRVTDLIDLLCEEKNPATGQVLAFEEQEQFRAFAAQVEGSIHGDYNAQLHELKDAYAPFDPDADTRTLYNPTPEERGFAQDELFTSFAKMLEKANYTRLTREEIEKEMQGASEWGVDLDVKWECFDQFEMFVRGKVIGQRSKRQKLRFWRVDKLPVPIFQRLVIVLKQKPHKRLGKTADIKSIFLKLFKDIPRMDLEMVIPGTRLKMPRLERGKLGLTILSSIGFLAYKFHSLALGIALTGGITTIAWTLYGPISVLAGYGYKTWAGFQQTKQAYLFQLSQSLYYQNLDNNAGCLFRLLDEAEEQEAREAILSYFFLWRYAGERGGWTAAELDDYIEIDMEKRLNIKIDFEIGDALAKLEQLQIAIKSADRWTAVPIDQALQKLGKKS